MLDAAQVPPERREMIRQADVRYRRQAYELTVPFTSGRINRLVTDALAEAFHAKHAQTYGHANRAEAVQLVNLRVTALGKLPRLTLTQRADPDSARMRERDVWFADDRVRGYAGALAARAGTGHAALRSRDYRGAGFDNRRAAWLAARFDEFGCIRLGRR